MLRSRTLLRRRVELTSAAKSMDEVTLSLTHSEALVFFEWLARNWERTQWAQAELFSNPAERQLLISIEGSLSPLIDDAFSGDYQICLDNAYRSVLQTMTSKSFGSCLKDGNAIPRSKVADDLGGIPTVNGRETNPAQIAEAVRSNSNYIEGSQVYFASCWSGSSGSAQELANVLKAPVYAPTRPVAWNASTNRWVFDTDIFGFGDIPRSDIAAEWKTYFPTGG